MSNKFCYDARFATFMETLTGKGPGEWMPELKKALELSEAGVTSEEFFDFFTDMRLGNLLVDREDG